MAVRADMSTLRRFDASTLQCFDASMLPLFASGTPDGCIVCRKRDDAPPPCSVAHSLPLLSRCRRFICVYSRSVVGLKLTRDRRRPRRKFGVKYTVRSSHVLSCGADVSPRLRPSTFSRHVSSRRARPQTTSTTCSLQLVTTKHTTIADEKVKTQMRNWKKK